MAFYALTAEAGSNFKPVKVLQGRCGARLVALPRQERVSVGGHR